MSRSEDCLVFLALLFGYECCCVKDSVVGRCCLHKQVGPVHRRQRAHTAGECARGDSLHCVLALLSVESCVCMGDAPILSRFSNSLTSLCQCIPPPPKTAMRFSNIQRKYCIIFQTAHFDRLYGEYFSCPFSRRVILLSMNTGP